MFFSDAAVASSEHNKVTSSSCPFLLQARTWICRHEDRVTDAKKRWSVSLTTVQPSLLVMAVHFLLSKGAGMLSQGWEAGDDRERWDNLSTWDALMSLLSFDDKITHTPLRIKGEGTQEESRDAKGILTYQGAFPFILFSWSGSMGKIIVKDYL